MANTPLQETIEFWNQLIEYADVMQKQTTGAEDVTWTAPNGETGKSFLGYVQELFMNFGHLPRFKTVEALQKNDTDFAAGVDGAIELKDGDYAFVGDDDAGQNGIYIKDGGEWKKSKYDMMLYTDEQITKRSDLYSAYDDDVAPILVDAKSNVLLGYSASEDSVVGAGLKPLSRLEQLEGSSVIPVLVDNSGKVLIGYDTEQDKAIIAGFNDGSAEVVANSTTHNYLPKLNSTDINHFLFYGQSLSIGARGLPVISSSQPYNNLTFDTGTIALTEPTDIKPLIEEDHNGYNAETPVSAACNYVSRDLEINKGKQASNHILFGSSAGVGGYNIAKLEKGTATYTNRFIDQVTKAKELTTGTYRVQVVGWVQGENDAVSTKQTPYQEYKDKLSKLVDDFNKDIKAITNQTDDIDLLTYQVSSYSNTHPDIALAQLDLALQDDRVHLVTPTYHLPHSPADNLHLDNVGYKLLGAYFGRAYIQRVIESREPDCIKPLNAKVSGKFVTVEFKVPTLPLVLDKDNLADTENYGFKVVGLNTANKHQIYNIHISGSSVVIELVTQPNEPLEVRYALDYVGTGFTVRQASSGNLRDSTDDTVSILNSEYTLYHVCPHFKLSTTTDKGI